MKAIYKILAVLMALCFAATGFAASVTYNEHGVLKLDRKNIDMLPDNFRTSDYAFEKDLLGGKEPSRTGMEDLRISGSKAFSELEYAEILKHIPAAPELIYDVDLRGESHGYINGSVVSWYKANDWGNKGRAHNEIVRNEKKLLAEIWDRLLGYDPTDAGGQIAANLYFGDKDKLMGVSHIVYREVEEEYYWDSTEAMTNWEEMKEKFKQGIILKDHVCCPATIVVEDKNTALITITEGKYHQIKRMFGCFGAKVVRLHRISMGGLQLPSDLKEGQCRELTAEELEKVCKRDK